MVKMKGNAGSQHVIYMYLKLTPDDRLHWASEAIPYSFQTYHYNKEAWTLILDRPWCFWLSVYWWLRFESDRIAGTVRLVNSRTPVGRDLGWLQATTFKLIVMI